MVADRFQDEDGSVCHLVELGYVDPDEAAASHAALRRRLDAELSRASESIRQSREAEAIEVLDRLAAEDSDWISPRLLLAKIHFREGNRKAARAHLDWLAHHNVVTPQLALMAATIAMHRRDLPAALPELEYAAHVEPTLGGIQSLLGAVQMRLGQWDAAADMLEKAVQQNSADTAALDGLATVALHRKDFENAAHWALEALEHDMQMFRAHYHLGMALMHLDRADAAAEAFATCARLDQTRAAPFYWLSRIAKHRGDAVSAAEYRAQGRQLIRQRSRRART